MDLGAPFPLRMIFCPTALNWFTNFSDFILRRTQTWGGGFAINFKISEVLVFEDLGFLIAICMYPPNWM